MHETQTSHRIILRGRGDARHRVSVQLNSHRSGQPVDRDPVFDTRSNLGRWQEKDRGGRDGKGQWLAA
jgi:hypothetical protein